MSLLKELVITDFKLRYQGSALGYIWSVMKPLAFFVVLYIVFSKFVRFDSVEHYALYLLVGVVIWNFFVEATTSGLESIVSRESLIRKVTLPKYVIVLSTSIAALINLFINLAVVAVFIVVTDVTLGLEALLFIPLMLELFIFAMAIAFILSALYVRYRDFSHLWEVVTQLAFYATPIIYPITLVPAPYNKILLMNPVAQVIQDSRQVLVTPETVTGADLVNSAKIFIPYLIVAVTVVIAVYYFKSQSKNFAENL